MRKDDTHKSRSVSNNSKESFFQDWQSNMINYIIG